MSLLRLVYLQPLIMPVRSKALCRKPALILYRSQPGCQTEEDRDKCGPADEEACDSVWKIVHLHLWNDSAEMQTKQTSDLPVVCVCHLPSRLCPIEDISSSCKELYPSLFTLELANPYHGTRGNFIHVPTETKHLDFHLQREMQLKYSFIYLLKCWACWSCYRIGDNTLYHSSALE